MQKRTQIYGTSVQNPSKINPKSVKICPKTLQYWTKIEKNRSRDQFWCRIVSRVAQRPFRYEKIMFFFSIFFDGWGKGWRARSVRNFSQTSTTEQCVLFSKFCILNSGSRRIKNLLKKFKIYSRNFGSFTKNESGTLILNVFWKTKKSVLARKMS